jgi:hypothetical protein
MMYRTYHRSIAPDAAALARASALTSSSALLPPRVLDLMERRAATARLVLGGLVVEAIAAADDILSAPRAGDKAKTGSVVADARTLRNAFPALHFDLCCQHFVDVRVRSDSEFVEENWVPV